MNPHSPRSDDLVLFLLPSPEEVQAIEPGLNRAGLACRKCAGAQDLCDSLDGASAAVVSQEALTAPVMTRLVQTLESKPERADFPFVLLFDSPGPTACEAVRLLDLLEPFGNLTVLQRPVHSLSLISAVRTAVRSRHTQQRVADQMRGLQQEVLAWDQRLARLVHKLRTPLNTILTATEILDQVGTLTSPASDQRALIRRQTLLLARLLGEVQGPQETVSASAALPKQSTEAPSPLARICKGQTGPTRLLLVEDDVECRESLQFLLRLQGMEVDVAANGTEGVQMAQDRRPEVILLDIDLPGLDGLKVARQIRSQFGDAVRLVALTGLGRESDRRKATEAGFDDCLIKPVPLQELFRALASPVRRDPERRD
jgi:CheY-like chemotaxis protein